MKTISKSIVLAALLGAYMSAEAQTLAMAPAPAKTENNTTVKADSPVSATENNAAAVAAPRFVFHTNGGIPDAKTAFEEEHYLGGAVSKKWNTFIANYKHEYSVSVGLSNSGYEFVKPAIYNAVNRADKYIKKALKSHTMTREAAVKATSHMLDCANVMYYEPDTDKFEAAAKSAKTGPEVLKLFESVSLIND